jgi:hypothetical protein
MNPRSTLSDVLSMLLRKWQGRPGIAPAVAPPPSPAPRRRPSGELGPLQTYLTDRFADTVVLTFDQIESITGVPLPAEARSEEAWWVPGTAARHTDAWTMAQRKATVNLPARLAAFERVTA